MSDLAHAQSNTVDDVIRRSASRFGDRVALRFEDRVWTYAELDRAVDAVAAYLRSLQLEPGARVAAYGKNSDVYVVAFLACSRAGLVHVPINYNLVARELDYLLDQSGSSAILVDEALQGRLAGVEHAPHMVLPLRGESSVLQVALGGTADPETPQVFSGSSDDTVVQLLYTSGTTSAPKGAVMTHRALLSEYISCVQALDFAADDETLHVMPLYHSAQMHVFVLPGLMVGSSSTILEVPAPDDILRRLSADGHRAFFAAPTLWVALANHPDFDRLGLGDLRRAYYGASIMPVPVLRRLQDRSPGLGFYNCFGQSEIGPLATVLGPDEHADRPDSAGRPVLFVEARVIDGEGNEVPAGDQGEIVYRSPQLCDGYWDNPDASAAAFEGGWFHSGDLVRRDEQGYVFVVDRIKDVINTGGVMVASREIEDVLYTHPAVAEVAVVGVPDEKWIEMVTAYVVTKGEVTADEIVAHARTGLAPFKVPKRVEFVDDLPRNASGKILKRELRDTAG
ncbi:acyl-CoA synthetase [Flexivirga endophytica]|uniref:Acyl-CoA synthetase n=1 Tax=Flexivirga endophytica TaxID=1849103 RepID=A0A916X195_9MICO|nr:fatty acyl-CoA synthetase [Flexivirga endophytica]GGB47156.1 acyl-CoA synthetase [Flexivirga endophytica]GHB67373.1 acyl-CoA synthetase [Flexivirga endophytica]